MFGTTVPKAAVDENGKAVPPEHEIRAARQGLVAAPAANSGCAENCGEFELGVSVAARANAGHHLAALGLCKHV